MKGETHFRKLIADLRLWADAADEGDRIAYAYAVGAPSPDVISQMGADIRESAALLEGMYAALAPLAECEIPEGCEHLPDSDSMRFFITLGEIRSARAALSRARGEAQGAHDS